MAQETIIWTKIDPQGRVVIPAELRAELGLKPGSSIAFVVEDGQVGLMTVRQGIKRTQERVKRQLKSEPGRSIVDEFIAERHAEAERE